MAVRLQVGQVAVQVQEKGRQSSWVSAQKLGQKRTVRGPRVGRQQSRADREFKGNRRGLGRGFWDDSGGRSAPV